MVANLMNYIVVFFLKKFDVLIKKEHITDIFTWYSFTW